YENITIASEKQRSGKGAAIKRGLNLAKGDLLGFIDADMATHPKELIKLKEEIDSGADIAIGSRNLKESDIKIKQPPHRIFLGMVYRGLVRTLLKVDVSDFQCGCKLFRREVWESLEIVSDDFAFDTELLAKASARSYIIKETPITWKNSEESKVNPLTDTLKMFRTILKVRGELNEDK
ncbi:MAG: glycosyltransferase, partial [Halobacteriota archaeon]|nr:glycosyltransferase [Halobacteriota archaeon]